MMSWDFSVNLVATRKPGVVQHSLSWMPRRLGRETPKVWRQKVGKRVSCQSIARGSREVRSSSQPTAAPALHHLTITTPPP